MEILYVILILLIVTRAFGELAERLGQPSLTGELTAGIVLGLLGTWLHGGLPVIGDIDNEPVFRAITDLGIFFLMLLAGMELQPWEVARATRRAFSVAMAGMLLPLALGMGLGWFYLPDSPYRVAQALFLGVALSVTAVPVAIKVIRDVRKMDTAAGRVIVSAAVVDDVLSLVLLAVMTAVIEEGALPGLGAVALLVGKVALFFVITIVLGHYLFPWVGRFLKRTCQEEFEFSSVLVAGLAYAALAEALAMHFIVGAFMAGLFFSRRSADPETLNDVHRKVSGITTGFLAPIFFASIGLHLDLSALGSIPVFVLVLLLLATIGKVAGAGIAGRLAGMTGQESMMVGVAMNARGAVELIIADVALRAGLFNLPDPPPPEVAGLFSAVVIVAVVTTLMTPVAINRVLGRKMHLEWRSIGRSCGAREPDD